MGNVNHIAFIVGGSKAYMREEKTTLDDAYERKFENVQRMMDACIERNIPTMTFLLLPQEIQKHDQYPLVVDSLVRFLHDLSKSPTLQKRQVKVSVLGHWYNLPGRLGT